MELDHPSSATAETETHALPELVNMQSLLWGPKINEDIFRRWSQGFEFSQSEPTALVQHQGGPCAVIAPVQAYLLTNLLAAESSTKTKPFDKVSPENVRNMLIQALCRILDKCRSNGQHFLMVLPNTTALPDTNDADRLVLQTDEAASSSSETPSAIALPFDPEYTSHEFHKRLIADTSIESVEQLQEFYATNIHLLTGRYGVLLFIYSVLLTKTLPAIEGELLDTSEPLIHDVYGYASQALINLVLTGRAVPDVWDNDQDVGGLKLKGINQQADVGFITLMEQMRYCTVGSFYKNPKHPVWVMGSETHLSVLFSNEKRLVSLETPGEIGRRVFKSFDPDGNNFIATKSLQEVLAGLNLVSDPEYVDIMAKRLDPESLGIILLNAFMDEFFCHSDRPAVPDTFDLFHYNGIPGSNDQHIVQYNRGVAILLESDLKSMCQTSNAMLTCLQTKWPTIEVSWNDSRTPSLN